MSRAARQLSGAPLAGALSRLRREPRSDAHIDEHGFWFGSEGR